MVTLAVPDVLSSMLGFVLGNTSLLGWNACALLALVLVPLLLVAAGSARVLDGLSLGEATAQKAWACRWRRCAPCWWPCWPWAPGRRWRRQA